MANWGGAWAGLSQQAFGMSMDSLRGMQQDKQLKAREEAARRAEEAREASRRAWEESRDATRFERERMIRGEDQEFQLGRDEATRAFQASESAAQRDLTKSYYDQMNRNEQARLGLQKEEMGQRERLAGMKASGEGAPSGEKVSATNVEQMFGSLREEFAGDPELLRRLNLVYSNPSLSPAQKAEQARLLRAAYDERSASRNTIGGGAPATQTRGLAAPRPSGPYNPGDPNTWGQNIPPG